MGLCQIPQFPRVLGVLNCEMSLRKSLPEVVIGLRETLKIGCLLWHWHHDGNSFIEESAYRLLDTAYATQQSEFLRHVLREHRKHRHRDRLDVIDS